MTRGKDRPTAPRARQRMATRASFVEAAHRLAHAGGDPLDPATVAAEAGVSRPLFYRYFPARGDFVEALLESVHESAADGAALDDGSLLAFFVRLAAPLDRDSALVRVLVPASLAPGPVADARARRRAAAIARLAERFPSGTPEAAARAELLMDVFLGLQLAWSWDVGGPSLLERVRTRMPWAIAGVTRTND